MSRVFVCIGISILISYVLVHMRVFIDSRFVCASELTFVCEHEHEHGCMHGFDNTIHPSTHVNEFANTRTIGYAHVYASIYR